MIEMEIFDELKRDLAEETLVAVATIVSGSAERIGAKLVIYPDGRTTGDFGEPELAGRVIDDARQLMLLERSENRVYGQTEVFIDTFAPKPRLIIFGGVHTAIPLTTFAQALGFRVTIVDGRERFANRERFPTADEIIVAWPDEALSLIRVNASTYVVILTHDPKFDIPTLAALAALPQVTPRYIGSMGSRETRRQHFAELRSRGVSDQFLATVHGPVGLDIGARSPEEIAVAILAEMIAVRYGRTGQPLSSHSEA